MMIVLSPRAKRDFRHIWSYCFEEFGSRRADELVARITATLNETIGTFPEAGRPRPEFKEGVHSFPVVPYVAFYSVEKRRVHVLRILHGHRDLQPPLMSLMVAG